MQPHNEKTPGDEPLDEQSAAPQKRHGDEPSPPLTSLLLERGGRNLYRWLRDLHLYLGLFLSPFLVVFAVSVFWLVHAWAPKSGVIERRARLLPLPWNIGELTGRARIDALRPALEQAGVHGEVGWINYSPRENRLTMPITVPGKVTTVTFDLAKKDARIEERRTGLAGALITLHKSPGPHLVDIRKNWTWMRVWSWLADGTVYLVMFLTVSGIYLWWVLRSERRVGLVLLGAGGVSFVVLVYALIG